MIAYRVPWRPFRRLRARWRRLVCRLRGHDVQPIAKGTLEHALSWGLGRWFCPRCGTWWSHRRKRWCR